MKKTTILAISGSTRAGSSNEKILKAVAGIYADPADLRIYQEITSLPFFEPGLPGDPVPEPVSALKNRIRLADAILITTPEYVFSIPAVLKNLLEWMVSDTLLSFKPVAFIVASADGRNTFDSLGLILSTLVQYTIPDERKMLLRGARGLIDAHGNFIDEEIKGQVCRLVDALITATSRDLSIQP